MPRAIRSRMGSRSLRAVLLRHGLVSVEWLEWAVASAPGTQSTWLELLVLHGAIDDERVCGCIATAAWLPRCVPQQLSEIARVALVRVPADLAVEHRAVPIAVESDGLRVAMIDPIDDAAVDELEFFAGCSILREVASATAIAWALHRHYGCFTALCPPPTVQAAPARRVSSPSAGRATPAPRPPASPP